MSRILGQVQCVDNIINSWLMSAIIVEIVEKTNFTYMQVKSHIQNGKRNLKLLMDKKRSITDE